MQDDEQVLRTRALERIQKHFMAAILAVKPDAHVGAGH